MDFSNLKLADDVSIYNPNNVADNVMGISSRNEEKVDYSSKLENLQKDRNYNSNPSPDRPNFDENQKLETDNSDLFSKMKALEESRNYSQQQQPQQQQPQMQQQQKQQQCNNSSKNLSNQLRTLVCL